FLKIIDDDHAQAAQLLAHSARFSTHLVNAQGWLVIDVDWRVDELLHAVTNLPPCLVHFPANFAQQIFFAYPRPVESDSLRDLFHWHFETEEQHRLFVFQAYGFCHCGAKHRFTHARAPANDDKIRIVESSESAIDSRHAELCFVFPDVAIDDRLDGFQRHIDASGD